MPARLDRLLSKLSCDLWPAGIGEPDGFLQALADRHPEHSAGLLSLAAIAMGSTAWDLQALRSAAPGQEAAAPDAADLALLANSWETAVSLLCAPALDNAWRLAGRRLVMVRGAPPPQLTPGELPWVELSKALHSSLTSSLAACGTALGLNHPLLAAMGGVTSPVDVAMWLAHLLRQLLDSGTIGSSSSAGGSAISEPGAAGGGSGGDSRQGVAGERRGGAAAPSLSASERPQWVMRLAAMLGDALHLCIRLSWPVQGGKPAGSTAVASGSSGGDSGGGGGGSGSKDVVAAARGSTAAPPVELATVKQLLQLLADAVASQYSAALEQQRDYITFRSIAADSAGHAAADEDVQHPESGVTGGSDGSTASGGSRDGQASAGQGSKDGDGGGDEEGEEEEEEEEEDATCAARQHALWTLCVLLQALALRLPAADAAAWADSLAASMCQMIEAATRSSAAAFQAAAAAFAEDSAVAGSDAAGTAQAGAAEQPSAASEPAGAAGTAQGAGAQQAACTAQQDGAAGAVPAVGGPGDSAAAAAGGPGGSAAAAARPDSEAVTDEEGRDLISCAEALTWLMARLQESASAARSSLTPLQHRDALQTLLRLLRSTAKHALAAADAVVAVCPAEPASGANSVEGLPSWLHNSAHLLAWAACAVAQRAAVWREALLQAGVVDELTE